jgi:hypothetical protein
LLDSPADFDELFAGRAEAVDAPLGVEREIVTQDEVGRSPERLLPVYPAEGQTILAAQENIFGYRKVRRKERFLMDHGDAVCGGLGGVSESDGAALPQHFAAVGRVHPRDDFHQRRLAGAVFPHQEVDLPRIHVEVAVPQGDDPAEPFSNVLELE